jgi:hypothetical protein
MPKRSETEHASAAARRTGHDRRRDRGEIRSVRLTRKLAQVIDGVDLSDASVGDRLDLPQRDAGMLIAEGWAEPEAKGRRRP